jgi:hypothetical protein
MAGSPRKRRPLTRLGTFGRRARRPPGRETNSAELIALFNSEILGKMKARKISTRPLSSIHVKKPIDDSPFCTLSQLIGYFDAAGNKLAEAHQYLRPDNTLGLRGRPDPKMFILNGVPLYLEIR